MKHNSQQGFTILELILSIFILSVALAGIFSSFAVMVILASNASDRLTGIYLAQDGLEIVSNIRDTNWLQKNTWYQSLYPDCQAGCELDYTTGTNVTGAKSVTPWSDPGDYLNIKNGFYVYDSLNLSPTKFKRKITVQLLSDNALKVVCDVFWDQKPNVLDPLAKQGHFQAELVLYNWH